MDFKCKHCKKSSIYRTYIQQSGPHIGLYCKECNRWIAWLNKDYIEEYNNFKYKSIICSSTKSLNIAALRDELLNDSLPVEIIYKAKNGFIVKYGDREQYLHTYTPLYTDEDLLVYYKLALYYINLSLSSSIDRDNKNNYTWSKSTRDFFTKNLYKVNPNKRSLQHHILCQLGIITYLELVDHPDKFASIYEYYRFCSTFRKGDTRYK